MRFDEAVDLAKLLVQSGVGVEVLAIGRFVPHEDVKPDTPWYVSFVADGWAKPNVLRSQKDLERFFPQKFRVTEKIERPTSIQEATLF
jgi:hypothetical protein